MDGLLRLRFIIANRRSKRTFLLLRKVTSSEDRALEIGNQLAHEIIHVVSLVMPLQTIGILPFLQKNDLVGIAYAFEILIADTAVFLAA